VRAQPTRREEATRHPADAEAHGVGGSEEGAARRQGESDAAKLDAEGGGRARRGAPPRGPAGGGPPPGAAAADADAVAASEAWSAGALDLRAFVDSFVDARTKFHAETALSRQVPSAPPY